nr:hypothetical protein [Tanacetum cinerariifolium]
MSSSAMDTNPSQPPGFTPVDVGMHKEDQQVTGGPTSIGVTSKEGSHPCLSSVKGANTISKHIDEANLEGDEFTSHDEISKEIKLEDLSKIVQNVKADFMDLDSLEDDPIIVVDESEDDEEDKDEGIHVDSNDETKDTLVSKPPSPNCEPVKTGVKHLFGGVVRAMMSSGRSIVASLENINGFLAVNTPPDDLIRIETGMIEKTMDTLDGSGMR